MFLDLEFYIALQSTSSGGSKGRGGGGGVGAQPTAQNFLNFVQFFLENLAKSYFDIPGGALSYGSAAVEEPLTSVKPISSIAVKI